MARGDELLIVDASESDREGMRKLFEAAGYVCTTTGNPAEARDLAGKKFFPAALVDLDVGSPGQGVDVARAIKSRSETTAIVLLAGRRSFEAAVEAHRAGLEDVVLKKPDQVSHLRRVVDRACERQRAMRTSGDGDALLREVTRVLDEAFRIMLAMAREKYVDVSMASIAQFRPRLMVVEGDQEMLRELAGLIQDKPWEIAAEMNGGGALDKMASHRFELVACRAELMDLQGTMVIRTIQAQHAETVGLVYTTPGAAGRIDIYRDGRLDDSVRPFPEAAQLVSTFDRIVNELGSTQSDRRVIQAFRGDHQDFFRRYAELKGRLARLFE